MINPAWPEIAKAAPANLHHGPGHDPLATSSIGAQRVARRYDRCPKAFFFRRSLRRYCHLLTLIDES